ncbi:MAG: hypothetical protein ACXVCV_05375 [Polyangia bacterium]
MRAHVELTPGERRLLTTLTAEERHVLAAQMIETVSEEFEWVIAVERANMAAESAQELATRVEPPTSSPAMLTQSQRHRWPSSGLRAAKR